MICKNCGNNLPEDARFCNRCGAQVLRPAQRQAPRVQAPGPSSRTGGFGGSQSQGAGNFNGTMQQQTNYIGSSKYSKVFVDPDEKLLGTLGNGYVENLLFGSVKKCHALLTDKRVYFQGRFLSESGRRSEWIISEKVVDLENITGTGFIYSKSIGILMTLILLIIPWIVAFCIDDEVAVIGVVSDVVILLFTIVVYILNRKTYFSMEYMGGAIKFDAKILGIPAVRDFQKQIHRAKARTTGKG